MAKLSSLVVDLQTDTAALKKGLDDANGMLSSFGKHAAEAGKLVAGMFAAHVLKEAVVGLSEFVLAGAEAADQSDKSAQAAGVTTEAYSHLSYAAELAGITNEELGVSLSKLNKAMGQAAAGGKEQTALFSALGIAVTDSSGHIRAADDVLGDIAEKFSHMKDGAAKATLAQEIFGKSGARLIPLLNEGRAGLADMAAEADKFGLTVSGAGAKSAQEFNDALIKVKKIGDGLARSIAQDLAPSFSNLADEMLREVKNTNLMKEASQNIANAFRILASAGFTVAGVFEHVGLTIAGLASAISLVVRNDFNGAKEVLEATGEAIGKNIENTKRRIEAIWSTDHTDPLDKEKKAVTENADSIVRDIERKKKSLEDYETAVKKLEKATEDLQFKTLTFGFTDSELLQARLLFGDLAEEIKKAGKQGEKFASQMIEAAKALEHLKLVQKAKDAVADIKTPYLGKPIKNAPDESPGGFAFNQPTAMRPGVDPRALRAQAEIVDSAIATERTITGAFASAAHGIAQGIGMAATDLLSAMGGVGDVIGGFLKTFQKEGFWQALIEAIGKIVAAAPAFGEIIDMAAGILKQLVGSVNDLIKGLESVLAAVGQALGSIFKALEPLFKVIGDVLTDIAPLLYFIGITVKATLAPILKLVAQAFKVLGPILEALFYVLKIVVLVSLYIIKGLAYAWNAIIDAIGEIAKLFGGQDAKDNIEKARATTKDLDDSIQELTDASWDSVKAQQAAAGEEYKYMGAQDKTADTMDKVNTAAEKAAAGLTNVPSLIKVNRLRGLAMNTSGVGQQIRDMIPEINLFLDGRQLEVAMTAREKTAIFQSTGKRSAGKLGGRT